MIVSAPPKITSAYEAYAEAMYTNPDVVRFDLIADAIAVILSKPGRQFPAIHVWMTETDPRAAIIRQRYDAAVAGGAKLPELSFKGPRKLRPDEQAANDAETQRLLQDINLENLRVGNPAMGAAFVAAFQGKTAA